MSRKCDLTGKGIQTGHNLPNSMHATKKTWKPNLQKKTYTDKDGKVVTQKLSTSAIRTLKKQGILVSGKPSVVAKKTTRKAA